MSIQPYRDMVCGTNSVYYTLDGTLPTSGGQFQVGDFIVGLRGSPGVWQCVTASPSPAWVSLMNAAGSVQTPWTQDIAAANFKLMNTGMIGIGTNPAGALDVQLANQWVYFHNNVGATPLPAVAYNYGLIFGWNASNGSGESWLMYGTGNGTSPALNIGRWNAVTKTADLILQAGNAGFGVAPTHLIDVVGGAYCNGTTWQNFSDEGSKTAHEEIDPEELLKSLEEMPVTKWSYQQEPEVRRIGPTAQGFQKAFGVGDDPKVISTVDGIGAALACIKGLLARIKVLEEKLACPINQQDALLPGHVR